MTTLREAAQQALEALEATHYDVGSAEKQRLQVMDAITALRAALAQQEQEPVAWRHKGAGHFSVTPLVSKFPEWEPLYTAPPRREWQELTEKEINDGRDQLPTEDLCGWSFRQGVYFAEKALKERNNG
jgi:hypothetical protein